MSSLESLPLDILLDELLPLLPIKDVLALFSMNRLFANLGKDDAIWERRLREDYRFTNTSIAGNLSLKLLYGRIHRPELYVWGDQSGGVIMGRPYFEMTRSSAGSLQFWPESPTRMKRVFDLETGLWSFSAINANGDFRAWGRFVTGYADRHPGMTTSRPSRRTVTNQTHQFQFRNNVEIVGRYDQAWRLTGWGRPFIHIRSPVNFSGDEIIQVQIGVKMSSGLTACGDVILWSRSFAWEKIHWMQDTIYQCDQTLKRLPWRAASVNSITLPGLPRLPLLRKGSTGDFLKIIEIALAFDYIIGLTNGGHVLKFDLRGIYIGNDIYKQRTWKYMLQFCEREKLKDLAAFSGENIAKLPPDFQIDHIAAHLDTFVAYSTGPNSVLIIGDKSIPEIVTALLGQNIVSVVLGSSHFGALTDDGRLFTWSNLSHSYSQRWAIQSPKEVEFNDYSVLRSRRCFVLAIASTHWQMGALVVNLEEKEPVILGLALLPLERGKRALYIAWDFKVHYICSFVLLIWWEMGVLIPLLFLIIWKFG